MTGHASLFLVVVIVLIILFVAFLILFVVLVGFHHFPRIAQIESARRATLIVPLQLLAIHIHVTVWTSDLFHSCLPSFRYRRDETIIKNPPRASAISPNSTPDRKSVV